MGRIPINTTVQPRQVIPMPVPSVGMGQDVIQAKASQASVISGAVGSIGQMLGQYAENNKAADMDADETTFNLFVKNRIKQADMEAERTRDPKEIDSIYSKADSDIQQYVSGSTNGMPNIRWTDQKKQLGDMALGMKMDISVISAAKKLQLYEEETNRKISLGSWEIYESALNNEATQEQAFTALDKLYAIGELDEKQLVSMKSDFETSQNWTTQNLKISEAAKAFESGLPTSQYIEILEGIKKENESVKLKQTGRSSLDTDINYKIANAKGVANKQAEKMLEDMRIKIRSNTFEQKDLIEMNEKLGPEFTSIMRKSARRELESMKPSNEKAATVVDVLENAANGKYSWKTALEKIDKTGSKMSVVGAMALADLYVEISQSESGDNRIEAYDSFMDGTLEFNASNSFFGRVINNVASLTSEGGADPEFIKKAFDLAYTWHNAKTYNGQKMENEDDFFLAAFGKKAEEVESKKQYQQRNLAPQQAINDLIANPELADEFMAYYGYLPEGF